MFRKWCLSFFFFSKKINLTELSYMFSSVWVGFRCECFFSVHWDLPFFLSNVPGRFSRQWNKTVSFDDFSKVPLFACWNGNILEYIGVKFPPYITKIVPTGARWSWCTRYQCYQQIHITAINLCYFTDYCCLKIYIKLDEISRHNVSNKKYTYHEKNDKFKAFPWMHNF